MNSKSLRGMSVLVTLFACLFITGRSSSSPQPRIPNPVLYLTRAEPHKTGGKQFTRYTYDVFNKDVYPAELFVASPDLPPCGKNTKASRTWVDVYDQSGKRLQGFCAFSKPADLKNIWFDVEEGTTPPSWVYVELTDRLTNTKYKSNLAETVE